MLPIKFHVNWPFSTEKRLKEILKMAAMAAILISDRNNFNYFNVQVTPMLPTKFQVNWPFGSGEEAKTRFSKWPPWQPSWISNRKYFSCV